MTAAFSIPCPKMATSRATGRWTLSMPGVARDPVPVPRSRVAARPGVRRHVGDDHASARERQPPGRHEPVAAVIARAAQDHDRAGAPTADVDGQRPDGRRDGGAGVLHEPLLRIAERLGPQVGAGHRLGGDRRQRGLGCPAAAQAAQVEREDRRVVGRQRRPPHPGPEREWASRRAWPAKRSRRAPGSRPAATRWSGRRQAGSTAGPAGRGSLVELDQALRGQRGQRGRDGRPIVLADRTGRKASSSRSARIEAGRRSGRGASATSRRTRPRAGGSRSRAACPAEVERPQRTCTRASRGRRRNPAGVGGRRRPRRPSPRVSSPPPDHAEPPHRPDAAGPARQGGRVPRDDPAKHPPDVCVDRAERLPERDRGDRSGRVRPDPRQGLEGADVIRHPATMALDDLSRSALQVERAPVVPEALPGAHDVGRVRGGQVDDRRECSRNRTHASPARAAWVCWAIASETRTAYGSLVRRNGSGRPCSAYQARMASRAAGGSGVGSGTSRG